MSTELVAIERINIKKDNGDADALRSCLCPLSTAVSGLCKH